MQKIDLVYLWVNGGDASWQLRNQQWLDKYPLLQKTAGSPCRWQEHDELKYSLRSAAKFAPWINHIFIVTDRQIPAWLNTNSPQISIVDHREIMPQAALPCFNSVALESRLPFIPGLSEYFLYANDDVFFGTPLAPDYFFNAHGRPIVMANLQLSFRKLFAKTSGWLTYGKGGLYARTIYRVLKMIEQLSGRRYLLEPGHGIDPMRKSYCLDTIARFQEDFDKTALSHFRREEDVQRFFFSLYDHIKDRNYLVLSRSHVPEKRLQYPVEAGTNFWTRLMWRLLWSWWCRRRLIVCGSAHAVRKIRKIPAANFLYQ